MEYTTIYEEYVQILEKIIDTKVLECFQQAQIQGFYMDFTQNFAEYAKVNNDTVEILFGFTDFNKFKRLVLDIKSGTIEVPMSQEDMAGSNVANLGEQFFWDLYKEDCNN